MLFIILLQFCFLTFVQPAMQVYDEYIGINKRDLESSKIREKSHIKVLKYFSGRYKSIPVEEETETEEIVESLNNSDIIIPMISKIQNSENINMDIFGGFFNSLLGIYLSRKFEVTADVASTPPYAVVHYYFPGDASTAKTVTIGEFSIVNCNNDTVKFCLPNSVQLCLSNNSIYCVTPIKSTMSCYLDGRLQRCLETTLKLPCQRKGVKNCEVTSPMHIPCYVTLNLATDYVNIVAKVYKTVYCVTVIAYPVKNLKNDDFVKYISQNDEGKSTVSKQANNFLNAVLEYVIH